MDKIYLNIFKDTDCDNEDYYIITKHDCKNLIRDIEEYHFDFSNYETIEELVEYLTEEKVDLRLINYIKKQDLETLDSPYELTMDLLAELDELVSFEEKTFNY